MTGGRRALWSLMFGVSAFASLAALSFVATPVKFLARGVPMADLLAVGRVTFRASLGVEMLILALLLITTVARARWLTCGAVAVLALQWFALMPGLDERTLARMAGSVLAPSSLHLWWIVLDVVRLGIYAILIGTVGRDFMRNKTSPRRAA